MVRAEKNNKLRLKTISKSIWDEFVFGSHLVALGDVSALYALSLILRIDTTLSFFIVVYLSILAINFFNRYKEADEDIINNFERFNSVNKYFKFMPQIMVGLFLVSVGITVFFAPFTALIFMLFLFSLGIFYTVFLKNVTKKIIGFKNFMTALPYGLLVIFLSLFYNVPITSSTILITIFYFIRMFINTSFFDIKDIESDRKEGLRTFAVVFGESKTKLFLLSLNFLSVLPIMIGIYLGILPTYSIIVLATVFYALLYLGKWKLFERPTILYNVVVDGELIFWLPYLLIGIILL